MSSEERGGGAAHRALEHFEGELMFEGEWIPPTPFNGIAFLAAGAVLRHLHRRTQARGEPRARALNEKRHARLARPDRASVPDASPSNHPTATDPRHPPLPRLHRSSPTENGDLNPNGRGRRRDGQPRRGRRRRGDDTAGDDWDRDDVAGVSGGDLRDGSTAVEAASDVDRARHVERRRDTDQREDPVTRLAAESREAHLRRVAQQLAARDGPNPSEGATPFGAPPPLDPHPSVVGEILPEAPPEPDRSVLPEAPSVCAGTVSPATSTLLAAESLSETARSQIAFFRRLSLDGGRRTEGDDEGAGLDEGASLEEGATEEGAVPGTPPPNDPEPSNDHEPPNDPKPPNDPVVVADDPEQRTCRFCLGGEEEGATGDGVLIAPCRCAGTQRWVHAGCLREWQRVSVSSAGRVERRCRVCRHAFRLPRPPIKDALTQWFNPTATDRLQCYRRAWWQMLSNSIMAQEGVEHIGTANQLARLFLATELRVWGGREVRGGNGALRALARAARLCTNAHSVVLLAWLASIGAAHVGERIERRMNFPSHSLHTRLGDGGPVAGGANAGKRLAGAICRLRRAVGGPLGWIVRLAVPGTTRAMRLADPVQAAISFFERYPQYRVM